MKTKKIYILTSITIFLTILFFSTLAVHPAVETQKAGVADSLPGIEKEIEAMRKKGKIPGLSVAIVKVEGDVYIKGFGYADLEKKIPVTPETLFELGSCSKAFTALAVLQLEEKSLIHLDDPVSHYLPWLFVQYKGQKYEITIRQLLHHTSGIPAATISLIPQDSSPEALEKTVKKIVGIELHSVPSRQFEYATINYDILGAVIQKVTGKTFEDYMLAEVFKPLGLTDTTVGVSTAIPSDERATGYKMSFFSPRKYQSPIFRGNNPAGYVLSNATDMARWLKFQMGLISSELNPLIGKTQAPDRTIPPNMRDFSFYAMGWKVIQVGSGEIFHTGLNPNFSTYIGFNPQVKIGVAVLCNLNSDYPALIGNYLLEFLAGGKKAIPNPPHNSYDNIFSLASLALAAYLLLIVISFGLIIRGFLKGTRHLVSLNREKVFLLMKALGLCIPILVGIYLFPRALAGFSWELMMVWAPTSLSITVVLILAAIASSLLIFFVSLLVPHKNVYINSMPFVVVLSSFAGMMNSAAIFIIIQAFSRAIPFRYLLFYFGLTVFLYFSVSTLVRTKLIEITNGVVYDLRMKLINRMFGTPYQTFEKLDIGKTYATVNNDTGRIGDSPNVIVSLINNIFIVLCIFIYLLTISLVPTLVTLGIILLIVLTYLFINKRVQVFLEQARDTQNRFMSLINGMLRGFKELCLHFNKKREYEKDLEEICRSFRQKRNLALIKYMKLSIFIEAVLLSVLGFASICFPVLFKNIDMYTLVSFVMILFYVAGPIANIMAGIPTLVQIQVSWRRIQNFIKELSPGDSPGNQKKINLFKSQPQSPPVLPPKSVVERIKVKGLTFAYEATNDQDSFSVGPIDFDIKKGEILFIIGGNGSGKTTLAKLLTGLYQSHQGQIEIEDQVFNPSQLGEYFSTVFSDYYLFEKLYDIDIRQKKAEIEKYLELLKLDDKVHLKDDSFSTIDLSGGQRKRLALLKCYLEDSPVYLFDEWAADQDPTFRKFFYRHLLPEMKKQGKIVIAITHDDNYFDAADKIIKMNLGNIESIQ